MSLRTVSALILLVAVCALGCGALAELGGFSVCISTPSHPATGSSATPSSVATVVPSASNAGAL